MIVGCATALCMGWLRLKNPGIFAVGLVIATYPARLISVKRSEPFTLNISRKFWTITDYTLRLLSILEGLLESTEEQSP